MHQIFYPEGLSFTDEQRKLLLKYFDEYGMTSTHRRNVDLMQKCAQEVGTSLDRVKVRRVALVICLSLSELFLELDRFGGCKEKEKSRHSPAP